MSWGYAIASLVNRWRSSRTASSCIRASPSLSSIASSTANEVGDFTSLEADDGRPIGGGDLVELDAERNDCRVVLGCGGSEDRCIGSGTEGASARYEGGEVSEGDRLACVRDIPLDADRHRVIVTACFTWAARHVRG